MQRQHSWASWELSKAYSKRHVYEEEPEPSPPYDDPMDPLPYVNWDGPPSTNPQLLCSRCMLAVLKIYSNRSGTPAFGLFHPPGEICILCKILRDVQKSSILEHESRVMTLMNTIVPYSTLSRAPPAHVKDLVVLWDDKPILDMGQGTRIVTKDIDIRGIRAIPKQQLNPFIIRSWLADCEDNHGEACRSTIEQPIGAIRNIMLIDVRHFCLVRKTLPCRYVALSYVWGKAQTFRLKEKDIGPLSGLEGLREIEDQLPRTIMDAIEFVRSIEEHHLWVDSVCIPQDNPLEMEQQIGNMASIYRIALLTLVAVSGEDAGSAIPGVQRGTRTLRSFFETPELTLAERMPSILPVLLSSHYNTRAWTFQERVLSSRCLYFTNEQVFLQCQTGIYREDRVACTPFDKLGRDVLTLKPLSAALVEASSPVGMSGLARNFMLYRQIVEEYTTKSLSYQTDILHAFSGVGEELGILVQTPITAGMPEKFFFRSMLFQPKRSTFTKRTAEMKHIDTETKKLVNLPFPSWSWCGWIGLVEYKNIGSAIASASQVQICTARQTSWEPAQFRAFAESIEPQSPAYASEQSLYPKPTMDVHPFTIRFMASVDVFGYLKLEKSDRGSNYLSVVNKRGQPCGLIRMDDPNSTQRDHERHKPVRQDTRSIGLILLCDIEQELIKQPEEADGSYQRSPWGPKVYQDGSPWALCAVLYVSWRGGMAERLGIGEVNKEEWKKADALSQAVYLV